MSKVLEQKVEIKGEIGSSFISAFKSATGSMEDLRQEARQVQRELDRLGNDFRNGKVHQSQYAEETRKLTQELNRLEQRQKTMSSLKGTLTSGWNSTKAVASIAAIGAGATAIATTMSAINTAADFEANMAKVGSKVSATKEEMAALKDTAFQLGASTSLSASQTALGMDELAAKGMAAKDIISAMPGIIAGAEASGEDLTLVSDVVTSAINAYGLQAKEASRVADVMAMSAIQSAAGVEDLGYSFKYAAPIAKTLGVELEELAASTGLLVDGGLAGEQAGTALRMAMTRLSAPPAEAQKALKKLNISVVDSENKFKSLAEITEDWNNATKDLTDTQKVQYASTVFGTEASTAMLSLFGEGADKIRTMTKALEESEGAATKTSAVMKDTFAGAKEQLSGAFDSAKIKFATPILPVLQDTMVGITGLIEDNLDSIESAGEKVANVLSQITAPFSTTEPVKPVITPEMDPNDAKKAMTDYQEALAKYDVFGKMDLGDKVDYMLDQTIDHVSDWVQGDGGEKLQDLFGELAAIAAGAWSTSFTTLVKGSMSELAEGDFGSAVAMGAAANAMTGGLLMTGGLAGGKYLLGKGKGLIGKGKASTAAAVPAVATTNPKSAKVASAPTTKPSAKPNFVETTSKASKLGTLGKYAGKAAMPIALVSGAVGIATSNNKAEATGSLAGSLAGGLGGTKLGAAIGTAIAPGIGTAIGGALGGLAGSIAGSGIGSKVGNWVGSKFGSTPSNTTAAAQPAVNSQLSNESMNQFNATIAGLNEKATSLSTSMTGLTTTVETANMSMATSLMPIQTNTTALVTNLATLNTETALAGINMQTTFSLIQTTSTLLVTNLNTLATNLSTASVGIAAINNIGSASQRVVSALNRLEQRINNASIPGTSGGGRLAYE